MPEKYLVMSPKKLGISQEKIKKIISKKDINFYKVRGYHVYKMKKVS